MTILTEKVPRKEKAAYFSANIGEILFQGTLNSFLLIFYVDVAGLHPAAVGTLLLVSRVVDAFSDPLIGFILDHLPETKWGRFRPWLALGGVLAGLNLWLLFAAPLLSTAFKLFVAYVTYMFAGIVLDLLVIPLIALISVMNQDDNERTKLATMRGLGALLGGLLSSVLTIPLVNRFKDEGTGWLVVVGVFGVIIAVTAVIGALNVKERVKVERERSYKPKDALRILFTNPPLALFFFQFLFVNSGTTVIMGALVFFFKYNLGNEELVGAGLMGMGLPMMLLIPFAPMLAKKFDKKWVYIVSLSLAGVWTLSRFFIPNPADNIVLVIATFFLTGASFGPSMPYNQAMIADIIDYTEWKFGERAEGIISSINPLITKFANGIGGALPGFMLAATGYVPDAVQTPEALRGISLTTTVIPFVLIVIGGTFLAFYPLTKIRMAGIQEDIRLRNLQS